MTDEKLWRQEGPKALIEFLTNATGEDHDAAVYDTKVEFDPSNVSAVRYVASIAMNKAEPLLMSWKKDEYRETFECQMPTDGSVAQYESDEGNQVVCMMRAERLHREETASGPCIYVPDSSSYCDAVTAALSRREIAMKDMTASELYQHHEDLKKERRTEAIGMFLKFYLPVAVLIIIFLYSILH